MTVQGLDRLNRKLKRLPRKAREEIGKALRDSGAEMVSLARNLAPAEDGTLRDSIHSTFYEDSLKVTIEAGGAATTKPVRDGADAEYDYAMGQEFGTRNMPANPFFFPAYRAIRKKAKSRLSRAITKAARAVAAGG